MEVYDADVVKRKRGLLFAVWLVLGQRIEPWSICLISPRLILWWRGLFQRLRLRHLQLARREICCATRRGGEDGCCGVASTSGWG